MKKKIVFASLAFLIPCLLANVSITTEDYNVSSDMINQLVYADSMTLEDVEARVVFSLSELDNIETTAQSAISNASNEYIAEQEKRLEEERLRQEEEKRKQEELASQRALVGDTYNPFVKTGLTVEQYNKILEGTALAGCGQSYFNMEQTYGVNGVFAISVAFHESGYGKYRANTNNFYGMKGSSGWMAFESPDANIQYFGKLMNKSIYYGKSITNIGKVYCPGTYTSWANAVQGMMSNCYKKVQ